ncbi:hypothetical protein [Bacillus sp. FJAT-29937]|uniref:hypothetical protein n=1 Tax=Bacillus sp. FJAT-29937 TaxID=1720553 RepID=UPI0008300EC6|nr:hypothetical protein [Bacillus sp. FJAT-29937]
MIRATKDEKNAIIKLFQRLDLEEIESPSEFFNVGILDRFPRTLTLEEVEGNLISFDVKWRSNSFELIKYLNEEGKYKKFFYDIFMENQSETYAFCVDFSKIMKSTMKMIKKDSGLNFKEIKGLINKIEESDGLIKIKDFATLSNLLAITLREYIFINFFFVKSKIAVIGNYEMNLPFYCKEQARFENISKLAETHGLFIRTK